MTDHSEAIETLEARQAEEASLVVKWGQEVERLLTERQEIDAALDEALREKNAAIERDTALGLSRGALMASERQSVS